MLSHPNNLSVALRLAVVLFALTFCSSWVCASKEQGSVTIKIYRENGTVAHYRAYPENAVKLLFPKSEAVIEPEESPKKWQPSSVTILKKIQTVRVSDTERRFNVMGATFGDQLFIFDGIFSDNNSVTMSLLIRATASGPRNKAEALDLAKLYLTLSYYRFADPDRFVAYKASDSTKKNNLGNSRSVSDIIGISHSPQVVQKGATYALDFYSYDDSGVIPTKVSHWQINVSPDTLEERLSAHHEGFHQQYSKATSETTQTTGKIKFSPSIMADGFTDDGAITDIQSWASSDGPGVQRTHFYYKSHEKADKRMQDYLHNAVAIIETRPWLDSQGKSVGTQALVIRITDSEKALIASEIFEDESSVLEISCFSLGNLLAVLHRELPDWKH